MKTIFTNLYKNIYFVVKKISKEQGAFHDTTTQSVKQKKKTKQNKKKTFFCFFFF